MIAAPITAKLTQAELMRFFEVHEFLLDDLVAVTRPYKYDLSSETVDSRPHLSDARSDGHVVLYTGVRGPDGSEIVTRIKLRDRFGDARRLDLNRAFELRVIRREMEELPP